MQTKEEILSKVDSLLENSTNEIKKHIERVLETGCLNLNEYENNWILPKLLVSSAYGKMQRSFEPPKDNRKLKKELKNINYFM